MVASARPPSSAATRLDDPGTYERLPNCIPSRSSITFAIESVPPPLECNKIGSPSRSLSDAYLVVVTGKNFNFESWNIMRRGAFDLCMAAYGVPNPISICPLSTAWIASSSSENAVHS